MSRPIRFEHYQWLGDKRRMVVHDLDATVDVRKIDDLMTSEQFASFGPDILDEARTAATSRVGTALPPDTTPASSVSGFALDHHLARPRSSAARDATRNGVVIAHGFPTGPSSGATAAQTFAELADRAASDSGWAALSFAFRGVGASKGRFSPAGWLEDLGAAVEFLRPEVGSVWLAGFGFGGTLAVRLAALDPTIGGVAAVGAPTDLSPWADDAPGMAKSSFVAGLLDTPTPDDLAAWPDQLRSMTPLASAALIPPRPFLVVHGSADDEVPLLDARALVDAAGGEADLRVIAMGGHALRHDPRAIAILLGWLERAVG